MLEWNRMKVRNLTGAEIWLVIVGRGLAAFGLGVLAARFFPQVANPLGIPALAVGMVLLVIGAKGLFRSPRQNAD
jgi:H+/gluconate symporter-like permease